MLTIAVPDSKLSLSLSELISSLSYALDLTEGQPPGHCMRCCWIGMHVAEHLELDAQQRWELYYTLLLKDLGCSSNAARICQLYVTDDHQFKRSFKTVDGSIGQVVRFVLGNTAMHSDLASRFRTLVQVMRDGREIAQELIHTRCERGAEIARQLRFSDGVCAGIRNLDEHWDGSGLPDRVAGTQIPVYSRVALLAQVVDVFQKGESPATAIDEVTRRSGTWFDPAIVAAFRAAAARPEFWRGLNSGNLQQTILGLEPANAAIEVDEDYLDELAAAFGKIVDAKSPYTAGHSERVALYTELITEELGMDLQHRRWLKRGALLHDIGKLGVSNAILDKPDRLTAEEWGEVQKHAGWTEQILGHLTVFSRLAQVAGAHHEKFDGTGYPKRLKGEQISLETRVITTADIFDAITADRPYREAIPVDRALEMMAEHLDSAIDRRCFAALQRSLDRIPDLGRGNGACSPTASAPVALRAVSHPVA